MCNSNEGQKTFLWIDFLSDQWWLKRWPYLWCTDNFDPWNELIWEVGITKHGHICLIQIWSIKWAIEWIIKDLKFWKKQFTKLSRCTKGRHNKHQHHKQSPLSPFWPFSPSLPSWPSLPGSPILPATPLGPGGPGLPGGPWGPGRLQVSWDEWMVKLCPFFKTEFTVCIE